MNVTNSDSGDAAAFNPTTEPNAPPPNKRRVLLYALTPVALLILLSVGMRMASEAAARQTAAIEDREQKQWKAVQSGTGEKNVKRPLPPLYIYHLANKTEQKNIEAAVRGQVTAIHAGDFEKALSFAAPEFRDQSTPEQFGQMIRSSYSPLLDAQNVALKAAQISPDSNSMNRAVIETVVRVSNGKSVYYSYLLSGQKGQWWVQGVTAHSDRNGMTNEMPAVPMRRDFIPEPGAMPEQE